MRSYINVYQPDGCPAEVVTNDPAIASALAGVPINFIGNRPDRSLFLRNVTPDERERLITEALACRANTQEHGLGIACEAAFERCRAIAAGFAEAGARIHRGLICRC